jgi:hypothetical protein
MTGRVTKGSPRAQNTKLTHSNRPRRSTLCQRRLPELAEPESPLFRCLFRSAHLGDQALVDHFRVQCVEMGVDEATWEINDRSTQIP